MADQPAMKLLTVGDIGKLLGLPAHRIAYAIDIYRIEPTQRAGILRLYDEARVQFIQSAIARLAQRSGRR